MGASLGTLALKFKLDELDNNYKDNVQITEPTCPSATSQLGESVVNNDLESVRKLCSDEGLDGGLNGGQVVEPLMMSIMMDRQEIFDEIFRVYAQHFNTILEKNKTDREKKAENPLLKEKNAVTDLIDDLSYTQISMGASLPDVVKCCAWAKNIHYFKTVSESLLKQMGFFASFGFFWSPLSLCAMRGNIDTLDYLDSAGVITQRLLLWVAYGAVAGDNISVLRWVFDNEKKLPVLDCILNACVYLDRIDMFKELYPKKTTDNYCLDDNLSNLVIDNKREVMFRLLLKENLFSSKSDSKVLDYCMELGLVENMVDLICLPEKECVSAEERHIKYIYQHSDSFNRLVKDYQSDPIGDVLCYVINNDNVDYIVQCAESRFGKLDDAKVLLLVSCVTDPQLIRRILQLYDIAPITSVASIKSAVDTICHESNSVLFDVLTESYGLVISSESLERFFRTAKYDLCLKALNKSPVYNPTKVLSGLFYRVDEWDKDSIESVLDIILIKDPALEVDRYDTFGFGKSTKTDVIDLILSKIKSLNKTSMLIDIVKYSCNDVMFYHIFRNYLAKESVSKKTIAEEFKYRADDMLKGKEFDRLLFLVKEMEIPLEYSVLKNIGDKYDDKRFSILSSTVDEAKKNGVTYDKMKELITICTQRVLGDLEKRFAPNETSSKKQRLDEGDENSD
ncbi:hypothetical protein YASMINEVIRUS_1061 [Yasminevirus sp. GU-2018]|uniref:Uncharacterized protein n=1 Tax=Yasminevirus sp. GU-2018 TaxID=2420051 RepID=A0A5K0U9B3_9VIRU|nr:hypothetical protein YASMINEVIRUS_1061 [Yasminevirus sp. GU-2018]